MTIKSILYSILMIVCFAGAMAGMYYFARAQGEQECATAPPDAQTNYTIGIVAMSVSSVFFLVFFILYLRAGKGDKK